MKLADYVTSTTQVKVQPVVHLDKKELLEFLRSQVESSPYISPSALAVIASTQIRCDMYIAGVHFRRLYNPYVLCAAVLVTSRNQTQRFLHWANDREQRKNGRFVPKYWSSRLARSHCCMLNIQDPESALTEITRRERTHINRLSVLSDPKKDFSNLLKTFDDLIKQTTKQQDAQGKDKAAAQSGVRLLLRTLVDPA